MGYLLIVGIQHFCKDIKAILNYALCINLGRYIILFFTEELAEWRQT